MSVSTAICVPGTQFYRTGLRHCPILQARAFARVRRGETEPVPRPLRGGLSVCFIVRSNVALSGGNPFRRDWRSAAVGAVLLGISGAKGAPRSCPGRLRDLDVVELRSHWHTVFGRLPPAHLARHLLFRSLAYRLQADRLGTLDWESQRLLDRSGRLRRLDRGP
jgi:Protein of unknown function (DUF2924)